MGQMLPFRVNTRLRSDKFATRTVSAAGTSVDAPEIPKVGLLKKIYLVYRGTVTTSSASLKDFGFNALKKIQVILNQGSDALVSCSGYGLQILNQVTNRGFAVNKAGAGSTTVDPRIYKIPTADGTAVSFQIVYEIPISMNAGKEFELGLINLQASDLRARVLVDAGANSDWGTGYTWVSGAVDFYYEYFEIPDKQEVSLPPDNIVVRTLEDIVQLTTAGDNLYEFIRQGGLLQAVHTVKPNATRNSTDVLNFQLKFNKGNTIENIADELMAYRIRRDNGVDLPDGTFAWQFMDMDDFPNTGLMTNVVDTEQITTVETLITLASSTTFGSNNNTIETVRRIIQQIK